MTRRPQWDPVIHDPILTDLVLRWKLDDYQVAERMEFSAVTIRHYREKLGLPRQRKVPVYASYSEPVQPAPTERPSPLKLAAHALGTRLVEKPSGYWLDGRPVNLPEMMRETNRVRARMGLAEVLGPESWKP